jgi:cell division protein FtsB
LKSLDSIKRFLEENSYRKNLILGGILLFVVILFAVFSQHGLLKKLDLELEKSELAKEIQAEKLKMDSLQDAANKLMNDSLEIERIAREKYGLIKPNEEVIFVDPHNQ